MVKNIHVYVVIKSFFYQHLFVSEPNLIADPVRCVLRGVVGSFVRGILIEDDQYKQTTTRISRFKNENLFRKVQTGRR
jgi:hypothetical protein